jgi:hypothetical protein
MRRVTIGMVAMFGLAPFALAAAPMASSSASATASASTTRVRA